MGTSLNAIGSGEKIVPLLTSKVASGGARRRLLGTLGGMYSRKIEKTPGAITEASKVIPVASHSKAPGLHETRALKLHV